MRRNVCAVGTRISADVIACAGHYCQRKCCNETANNCFHFSLLIKTAHENKRKARGQNWRNAAQTAPGLREDARRIAAGQRARQRRHRYFAAFASTIARSSFVRFWASATCCGDIFFSRSSRLSAAFLSVFAARFHHAYASAWFCSTPSPEK